MTRPAPENGPFAKGIVLSLGIILFGFLLLAGLYLAPAPKVAPAPQEVPAKAPDRKLKFVSLDVRHRHLATEPVILAIKKMNPDFVLLQNVEEEDVVPIAEALSLQSFYHPQLFQRATGAGGRPLTWGRCVFSRYAMFEEGAVGGAYGSLGVIAICVIDDRKFAVASVDLAEPSFAAKAQQLVAEWHAKHSAPIVLGGQFAAPLEPSTLVQEQTGWFEGLTPFAQLGLHRGSDLPASARFYLSPGWSCVGGGVIGGFELSPVWIEATSVVAAGPFTTRPADEQ